MNHSRTERPSLGRLRRVFLRTVLSAIGVTLCLVGGEVFLRIGITLGVGKLDNPANYVAPFCDDDYHKLRYLWRPGGALRTGRHIQHPWLGWVPAEDFSGFESGSVAPIPDSRPADPRIVLFGDSFAAGVNPTRPFERIAARLDAMIPQGKVINYAVAGYGVDQIYLRFTDVITDSNDAHQVAIVGIFLGDIDRVLEHFRAGPKPYFEIESGSLALKGVPVRDTPEDWLAKNPPRVFSFSWALARKRFGEVFLGELYGFETLCRRAEKEEITSHLLKRMTVDAERAGAQLIFVVFYGQPHLVGESWRETFLLSELEALKASFIDTKPLLVEASRDRNDELEDYYFGPPNGHLNDRGNALVADAFYDLLAQSFDWGPRPDPDASRQTVSLGQQGDLEIGGGEGWGFHGSNFSWMVEPSSSIFFSEVPPHGALVVHLEVVGSLRQPEDDRHLSVRVNDEQVYQRPLAEFPTNWGAFNLRVPVPRALVQGDSLSVTLELPYLLTPSDVRPGENDSRPRGVALKSMTLQALRR